MSVLHKVTATEQLVCDATIFALCRHFGDQRVRWVHWTLKDGPDGAGKCQPPIARASYYYFDGVVEVPRLGATFLARLQCVLREFKDGSQMVHAVRCTSPFCDKEVVELDSPLDYMSYILGERHPNGRSKDDLPKFLPKQFLLPPRPRSSW